MLTFVLLAATLIMKLWPETPTARRLHQALVEAPLDFLAGMERRHLIYFLLILAAAAAGSEILLVSGTADLGLLAIWDAATYVDVAVAVVAAGAIGRVRGAAFALRSRVAALVRRRTRRRRSRPARAPTPRSGRGGKGDRWVTPPAFA